MVDADRPRPGGGIELRTFLLWGKSAYTVDLMYSWDRAFVQDCKHSTTNKQSETGEDISMDSELDPPPLILFSKDLQIWSGFLDGPMLARHLKSPYAVKN